MWDYCRVKGGTSLYWALFFTVFSPQFLKEGVLFVIYTSLRHICRQLHLNWSLYVCNKLWEIIATHSSSLVIVIACSVHSCIVPILYLLSTTFLTFECFCYVVMLIKVSYKRYYYCNIRMYINLSTWFKFEFTHTW